MKREKKIARVEFQITSGGVESDSPVLELVDENNYPFMEIRMIADGSHQVIFYGSNVNTAFSLSDLIKGIEIAQREVQPVELD